MSHPNPERDGRVEVPKQIWMTVFTDDKDPRFILADWRTPDVRNTQPGDYVAIRPHHKVEYVPVEAVNDAATRMRDRCVDRVRSLAGSWAKSVEDQWDERPDLSFDAAERLKAVGEIITALQSLTLEQGEQEK